MARITKQERSPFPSLESMVVECLVFTKREQDILMKASAIARQARELLEKEYGWEMVESSDLDLWLAEVEHNAKDLASSELRTTQMRPVNS